MTTALSPFDHPWQSGLFSDEPVTSLFTAEAELSGMLRFEAELARAEAAEGLIPSDAAEAISATCRAFKCDMAGLRAGFSRDGVAIPELVRQLKEALPEVFRQHVHLGATSQDVIDTSLLLRLKRTLILIDGGLARLAEMFDSLSAAHGARELIGRTRMRRAQPITLADKIATWREPLLRHRQRLEQIVPRVFVVQLGGAVGTRHELGPRAQAIADRLADALGLGRSNAARHSQRDGFVEAGNWLSLVSGSLGKFGQDIAIMAMNEVGEIRLSDAGTSSAMPGKSNPVKAEILVSLARLNATLVSGLNHALVHENERSGAAWTLEWLILPQMAMTAAASVKLAEQLLTSIDVAGD